MVLLLVVAVAVAIGLYVTRSTPPALTPIQQRIVTLADSQLGYHTDPSDTYCNRFSAYWHAGEDSCGNGNLSEEWCADFAAWVWRQAGVRFAYGQDAGEISSASISFYYWGVAHRTWHAATKGYVPAAGDVAVYGLDLAAGSAQHVAVVTGYRQGERGPDVVNGDGARTGFSVVEVGKNQYKADLHGNGGLLAGYVAPSRSLALR